LYSQQLNSPTAQQPNGPTAQQPNSPTAQKPNGPTAQPNSPTAQRLNSLTAQLPNGPTAQRPTCPGMKATSLKTIRSGQARLTNWRQNEKKTFQKSLFSRENKLERFVLGKLFYLIFKEKH
jgi:hypothetical protein